ncbi:MAG: amidase family protein, partial [Alphaproteobacteria bacterium]
DLWRMLEVLGGPDPGDPASLPVALGERGASGKLRIARMCTETGAVVEPEVEAALDATADILVKAGYEIVPGGIPNAERAPEVWAELIGTELINTAMPVWREQMGDSGAQHIDAMFGLFEVGNDATRYIKAFIERRTMVRETALWMEQHPLVLAPVAGMATPPLDFDHYLDGRHTRDLFDHMRNVMWVNLLSLPGVALPNGIQIVARRFREAEALDAAEVVERALGPVEIADVAA